VARPQVNEINLTDIAVGLSLVCRFSGQLLDGPYSVAAHSVAVSYWIEANGGTPREALTGLLHDASEAYCSDVPSPVKYKCKDYQRIEEKFQKAIAKRFKLPYPFPDVVHKADIAVLVDEKKYQEGLVDISMSNRGVYSMARLFINRFKELGGVE
jgi:hypothetical protein